MLPLSLQLQATAKAVAFVISGRSLNDVLADGSVVKPDLRSGVQALSFAVLRHLGMARALRQLLAAREPMPPVDALLCTALALLVCEANSGVTYTDFTLVNQTVEAAKAHSKTRSSASFINATLRRFLRERDSLMMQASKSEEALYNHPQWWINQLRLEQPDRWEMMHSHGCLRSKELFAQRPIRLVGLYCKMHQPCRACRITQMVGFPYKT
jgi:16S rRNA (cytosine967-C5)-methyltransferase